MGARIISLHLLICSLNDDRRLHKGVEGAMVGISAGLSKCEAISATLCSNRVVTARVK